MGPPEFKKLRYYYVIMMVRKQKMSVWIALQPRGLIAGGGNEGDLAPNILINENNQNIRRRQHKPMEDRFAIEVKFQIKEYQTLD